jgi:site-specific DNA-methyltransferase (adenine-specific)
MNIGLAIDKKEGLQGQRGVGGFNVGGLGEQENRKAKLYIGSTTDGSKQKAYTDYKSNLAKQWQGWGTCLKPSYEPIIVARKPFKGSCVDNIIKYGVGGLNIDECRVGNEKLINKGMSSLGVMHDDNWVSNTEVVNEVEGRFPANTILTYDETDFDEVCGGFPNSKSHQNSVIKKDLMRFDVGNIGKGGNVDLSNTYNDSGSASRYFYCAKASKKDRDEGLEEFADNYMAFSNQAKAELKRGNIEFKGNEENPMNFVNSISVRKNIHPTVKPTELMQYLVRLVSPKGAIILDPFMGSGSTGKAVAYENKERNADYKFIGIEMEKEYCKIAEYRIKYVLNKE